ncbi:MAG: hypothetical protein FGM40_07550 [Rhodocyclaceae bacterium]|nr:hypothetical protein [Rhodocyclaceae bacterium]
MRQRPPRAPVRGFLLTDACVALALAGLLALAAAGLTAQVGASRVRLDASLQARTTASAALSWVGDQIRQAGALQPPPTVDAARPVSPPLRPALSADSGGVAGDRLLIQHESRTDCLGNTRSAGQDYYDTARRPVALTQSNLVYVSRTATGGPSLMCDPDASGPATAQAFASQIEAMQLRFWLRGGSAWVARTAVSAWDSVQLVEVCLVLTGGRLSDCPAATDAVRSPRVLVGVFGLRNAA